MSRDRWLFFRAAPVLWLHRRADECLARKDLTPALLSGNVSIEIGKVTFALLIPQVPQTEVYHHEISLLNCLR